jgi:hypothetical protein
MFFIFHVKAGFARCLRRVTFFCLDAKESNQRKNQVLLVKLLATLVRQYEQNIFTEPLTRLVGRSGRWGLSEL